MKEIDLLFYCSTSLVSYFPGPLSSEFSWTLSTSPLASTPSSHRPDPLFSWTLSTFPLPSAPSPYRPVPRFSSQPLCSCKTRRVFTVLQLSFLVGVSFTLFVFSLVLALVHPPVLLWSQGLVRSNSFFHFWWVYVSYELTSNLLPRIELRL